MLKLMKRLVADRRGGTAIEYGLILSLLVITMMVSFVELANTTTGMWNNVSTKVSKASGSQ